MLKKLEGNHAELFKEWIYDNQDTIFDVEGKHYLVKPLSNIVQEEIECDIELKELILQAKRDITEGAHYSTDDLIEDIEKGQL